MNDVELIKQILTVIMEEHLAGQSERALEHTLDRLNAGVPVTFGDEAANDSPT